MVSHEEHWLELKKAITGVVEKRLNRGASKESVRGYLRGLIGKWEHTFLADKVSKHVEELLHVL